MDKFSFLIVGLGNIGVEYEYTRHNIGFMALDYLAENLNVEFKEECLALVARGEYHNNQVVLIKPTTFMNNSGDAVEYWMKKEGISLDNLLVVVDDLTLPFCHLRIKPSGSEAGHNGL